MFEIGNTLREARLRRSLDITDCESATKIRGKYLRALEEEQFELLPGPTFVRGFLRTYADFLDLDGRLVVDEYVVRFDRPREASAFEDVLRRARSRRRSRESRLLIVAAAIVMLASVGVWAFTSGSAATATGSAAESVTAVFAASGRQATYVEAREGGPDGRQLFTPVSIPPSRPVTVTATPPIWVHVGDGSGLSLTVNGNAIRTPQGRTEFRVLETGVILTGP